MNSNGDGGGELRESCKEFLMELAVDIVAEYTSESFIAVSLGCGDSIVGKCVFLPLEGVDGAVRFYDFVTRTKAKDNTSCGISLAKFVVGLFNGSETSTCTLLRRNRRL